MIFAIAFTAFQKDFEKVTQTIAAAADTDRLSLPFSAHGNAVAAAESD